MSLYSRKLFLAISIPTFAAILGTLWLRNRRKKQLHLIEKLSKDKNSDDKTVSMKSDHKMSLDKISTRTVVANGKKLSEVIVEQKCNNNVVKNRTYKNPNTKVVETNCRDVTNADKQIVSDNVIKKDLPKMKDIKIDTDNLDTNLENNHLLEKLNCLTINNDAKQDSGNPCPMDKMLDSPTGNNNNINNSGDSGKGDSPFQSPADSPLLRTPSTSPVQRTSISPVQRTSISPVQRKSISPVQRKSISPVQRTSISPVQRTSISPVQRTSISPVQRTSISPVQLTTVSPVQTTPISPVQTTPISPVQTTPISPVQKTPISPVQKTPISPVQKTPISPVQITPISPVQRTPSIPPVQRIPSITPAYLPGSNFTGAQPQEKYGFLVPYNVTGIIIGSGGRNIKEVTRGTNATLIIKKYFEDENFNLATIKGLPKEIELVLKRLKQKFKTLKVLTFEEIKPQPKMDDRTLKLVYGVNNEVVVTTFINAGHLYVQMPNHPAYLSLLNNLQQDMDFNYDQKVSPPVPPGIAAVCVAKFQKAWYRVQIIRFEEDGIHCQVFFLDWGTTLQMKIADLRQIKPRYFKLPFQAIECMLAHVIPDGDDWSEEAKEYVESMTSKRFLFAQVYAFTEHDVPLIHLFANVNNSLILVNEMLVFHGFAHPKFDDGSSSFDEYFTKNGYLVDIPAMSHPHHKSKLAATLGEFSNDGCTIPNHEFLNGSAESCSVAPQEFQPMAAGYSVEAKEFHPMSEGS